MKGISKNLSPTTKRKDSPMKRAKKGIEEIKNLFNLHGKVAVVTGGAGALGKAVSIGLAAYGVDVVVGDLDEAALEELSDKVREMGRKALPVSCDVTDPDRVDQMVRRTLDEFGKINILFNAAGIAQRDPAVEMAMGDWQKVMDVNVKGTLLCSRAVAREMIRQGQGGNIITVGSVRGFHAHEGGYSAYGTSKAAIHYLTKQLAFEWAKHKIRVNCIAPCVFWSPLTEPILSDEASYKGYVARIPLGRAAEPEDFVGVTIFLASDASEMVTGHVLSVDGGTVGG
jgi:NAD(P)-dependent dehydrogenase (short-subunit alcohol dehydrogenase family)